MNEGATYVKWIATISLNKVGFLEISSVTIEKI